MKRVFAAIDVSDEAGRSISLYIEELRKEFKELRVRWEQREKLHITVKFAGSLDERQLESFADLIRKTASRYSHFNVKIAGTGAFLKAHKSNVLWLGIEVDSSPNVQNSLDGIIATLYGPCGEMGLEHTKRAFNPHLTIARLKEPQNSKDLVDKHLASGFEPVAFKASEIVIYESKLRPTGSVYSKIAGFQLKSNA